MFNKRAVTLALLACQPIGAASAAVTMDISGAYGNQVSFIASLTTAQFLANTPAPLSAAVSVTKVIAEVTAQGVKVPEGTAARTQVTIRNVRTGAVEAITVNTDCLASATSVCRQNPKDDRSAQLTFTQTGDDFRYQIYRYSAADDDLVLAGSITLDHSLPTGGASSFNQVETRSGVVAPEYQGGLFPRLSFMAPFDERFFVLLTGLTTVTNVNAFRQGEAFDNPGPSGKLINFNAHVVISGQPDPLIPGPGAVPEPSTWAMLITGFGAIGAALRSRRVVRVAGLPMHGPRPVG